MYVCMNMSFKCMYVCMHVCMYVIRVIGIQIIHTYLCTVNINMYTFIHIYIHTYIHTYIHVERLFCASRSWASPFPARHHCSHRSTSQWDPRPGWWYWERTDAVRDGLVYVCMYVCMYVCVNVFLCI